MAPAISKRMALNLTLTKAPLSLFNEHERKGRKGEGSKNKNAAAAPAALISLPESGRQRGIQREQSLAQLGELFFPTPHTPPQPSSYIYCSRSPTHLSLQIEFDFGSCSPFYFRLVRFFGCAAASASAALKAQLTGGQRIIYRCCFMATTWLSPAAVRPRLRLRLRLVSNRSFIVSRRV